MKALFINTTKYSKEEMDKFIQFHSHKYIKKYIIITVIFIIYMLAILINNLIHKRWNFVFVIIAVFAVAYIYFRHINVDKKKENNKKQLEQIFKFSFFDNKVTIKGEKEKSELKYHEFYKIFETKTNFYMYINSEYSLILDKEGFEKGNLEEFRKFIKKKCFLKYRKAYKSGSFSRTNNSSRGD